MKVWISKLYRRFATRSRHLGVLILYKTNLWRYNSQKALDTFLYGRPQQTSQIPFMITRTMRKSLASLGYTEQDVNKMTPIEASNTIKHCTRKSLLNSAPSNSPHHNVPKERTD